MVILSAPYFQPRIGKNPVVRSGCTTQSKYDRSYHQRVHTASRPTSTLPYFAFSSLLLLLLLLHYTTLLSPFSSYPPVSPSLSLYNPSLHLTVITPHPNPGGGSYMMLQSIFLPTPLPPIPSPLHSNPSPTRNHQAPFPATRSQSHRQNTCLLPPPLTITA